MVHYPIEVWQNCPGSPLQLQQVLDSHLSEGVAGVQLHDQPHHDGDEHGDGGDLEQTLALHHPGGQDTLTLVRTAEFL